MEAIRLFQDVGTNVNRKIKCVISVSTANLSLALIEVCNRNVHEYVEILHGTF